jgi:hypothetical protein
MLSVRPLWRSPPINDIRRSIFAFIGIRSRNSRFFRPKSIGRQLAQFVPVPPWHASTTRKRRHTDKRMSYRNIAAEMAKQGHVNRSGETHGPSAIQSMLTRSATMNSITMSGGADFGVKGSAGTAT